MSKTQPPKPMLATGIRDLSEVRNYPVIVQRKYDGVRCIMWHGVAYSRSLKPIPSNAIQMYAKVNGPWLHGFDGELLVGRTFQETQSFVMTIANNQLPDDFRFVVFDCIGPQFDPYHLRRKYYTQVINRQWPKHTVQTQEYVCNGPEHIERLVEIEALNASEGVIIRDPDGRYKHGRSTLREGALLKYKFEADMEGEVVGWYPLVREDDTVVEHMVGALNLKITFNGVKQFVKVGTGFTDDQRREMYFDREDLVGRLVKFRYTPTGSVHKPRFPSFLGFRDRIDLDDNNSV